MSEGTPPDSATDPAPNGSPAPDTDGGDSRPRRDWAAPLAFLGSWRGLIVLLIAAIAGSVLIFPSWPTRAGFLLRPPKALLFVDSPEVYTRERLINDRLQEDLWLREQLEALRENDRFIRIVESSATRVGVTASGESGGGVASETVATEPQADASEETAKGRPDGNLVLTFD